MLRRYLREALAHAMLIVLDLRQLDFIDAAGLHVICDASEVATARHRRLMLVRGRRQVDRLFALTGLSEKLNVFDLVRHEGNLAPLQAPPSARDISPAMQTTVHAA
jgi:anti-anti-sigma factor